MWHLQSELLPANECHEEILFKEGGGLTPAHLHVLLNKYLPWVIPQFMTHKQLSCRRSPGDLIRATDLEPQFQAFPSCTTANSLLPETFLISVYQKVPWSLRCVHLWPQRQRVISVIRCTCHSQLTSGPSSATAREPMNSSPTPKQVYYQSDQKLFPKPGGTHHPSGFLFIFVTCLCWLRLGNCSRHGQQGHNSKGLAAGGDKREMLLPDKQRAHNYNG